MIARLFELQIIFGAKNRDLAEGNRIKKEILVAPRGMIYGREGEALVRNLPVYRLALEPNDPATEWQTITRDEALSRQARGETEGLRIDVGRQYLYGSALAHLLGYLGEANQEEVDQAQAQLGDLVGRTGIEQAYNQVLKGQNGGEIFEVNAQGEKIRQIGQQAPQPGEDIYLSVDPQLSEVAFEALAGKKGAVVVAEAKTGQILALVSSPSFDPEKIEQTVLHDQEKPMFNRAIGGLYPPGSTFKIVTAVAGLEEGKIDAQTIYEDTGQIQVNDFTYKNWYFNQYGRTEGKIDLVRAIKRSTDTFFYKVGEWVGPDKLADWGRKFGLGQVSGIDLPSESEGLMPDPDWKRRVKDERWFLGNTYHLAIGQADLLTTPLQVNLMTSVIANQGRLCQPRVVKSDSPECQDLNLNLETLRLVKEGMKEACSDGGTAFPLFDFNPANDPAAGGVACKTGTAEFADPEGRTHAWLTAFAPASAEAAADKPAIVVTVLVEAGGEGSAVAAPIARKVLEEWFKE